MNRNTIVSTIVLVGLLAGAFAVVIWGARLGLERADLAPPEWNCIEPAEGIGWAMFCEVGSCNVLFYGDGVTMECE